MIGVVFGLAILALIVGLAGSGLAAWLYVMREQNREDWLRWSQEERQILAKAAEEQFQDRLKMFDSRLDEGETLRKQVEGLLGRARRDIRAAAAELNNEQMTDTQGGRVAVRTDRPVLPMPPPLPQLQNGQQTVEVPTEAKTVGPWSN